MAAAPIVLPAKPSAFKFHNAPDPALAWNSALANSEDPLVQVATGESFLRSVQLPGFDWEQHPAAPAVATHFVTRFSNMEGLLHGCFTTVDNAILSSSPFERHVRLDALSDCWDALVEVGQLDTDVVHRHAVVLICALEDARARAVADVRLSLTIAKTAPVELVPATTAIAKRWPNLLLTRDLTGSDTPLTQEALLLRSISPRCTATSRASNSASLLFLAEDARIAVAGNSAMMSRLVTVTASNIPHITSFVSKYWKELLIPTCLRHFPSGQADTLLYFDVVSRFLHSEGSIKRAAFAVLLTEALPFFEVLSSILLDTIPRSQLELLSLWEQLAKIYLPSDDPLSASSLIAVETQAAEIEPSRLAAMLDPDSASARVLYHAEQVERRLSSRKQELKAVADTGKGVSNKADSIHTKQFNDTATLCQALISTGGPGTDVCELYQTVFKSQDKLLVLFLADRTSAVSGCAIFNRLSPFKGKMGEYLSWCLSVDEDGEVPSALDSKILAPAQVNALLDGNWNVHLQLLNLTKTWEKLFRNQEWDCIPETEWYLQEQHIRCLKKFGTRLFEGINRTGGSGKGSFTWICDRGIEILDSSHSSLCSLADAQQNVQWWFHAALGEAGDAYRAELRSDSDFRIPLLNVFLPLTSKCIAKLDRKLRRLAQLEELVEELPDTMSAIFASNVSAPAPPQSSAAMSFSNVVSLTVNPKRTLAMLPNMAKLAKPTPHGTASPSHLIVAAAPAPSNSVAVSAPSTALSMAKRLQIIGNRSDLLRIADKYGVAHADISNNTYHHLGKRKAKTKDLIREFGNHICFGVLMSAMKGDKRFSACNGSGPDHASFTSPAHIMPANYRARVKALFRNSLTSATTPVAHSLSPRPARCAPSEVGPDDGGLCLDFTFYDIFAGTSAFSEYAAPKGGIPLGFVEISEPDRLILAELHPSAQLSSDFRNESWTSWHQAADAVLCWPPCKHLSNAGLQRMQLDSCADLLWAPAAFAERLCSFVVVIENVTRLEELDHKHGLLARAMSCFETHGFEFSGTFWLYDPDLGGNTRRLRCFVVFEHISVANRIPILYPPSCEGAPGSIQSCISADEIQDARLLVVNGEFQDDPVWTNYSLKAGYFIFSHERPFQPGVELNLPFSRGRWVVLRDQGASIEVRSLNRRNPVKFTVDCGRLTQPIEVVDFRWEVWGVLGVAPTLRSFPDPPGNCLIFDPRLTAVRSLSELEEWRLQGRSQDTLRMAQLQRYPSLRARAGKAVTGAMAKTLSSIIQTRVTCARAASHAATPCLSADASTGSESTILWLVVTDRDSSFVLTAAAGTMLPGLLLSGNRESAIMATHKYLKERLKCFVCTPFLAGEQLAGKTLKLVIACPVDSMEAVVLSSVLEWSPPSVQTSSPCSAIVHTAWYRLSCFTSPVVDKMATQFVQGALMSRLQPVQVTAHPESWNWHCLAATRALAQLHNALDGEIVTLNQAKLGRSCCCPSVTLNAVQPCPCNLTNAEQVAYLSMWRDRTEPFVPEEVPPGLRLLIAAPGGTKLVPFPVVHEPQQTMWMPLKTPEPRFFRLVSSFEECLTPSGFQAYVQHRALLSNFLRNQGTRPPPFALNELDWASWARGKRLDLRKLSDGVVMELDYSQPITSYFNKEYIMARCSDFPDQELVSFMVLGVRFKAEIHQQLLELQHLLTLQDVHEEVKDDVLELREFGWVEEFAFPPFLPCRCNGKGVVPKPGGRIRPIDEAGGPRKETRDSRGFKVWSLNELSDGKDLPDAYSEFGYFDKHKANKWVPEFKPSTKHARLAIAIIREGAALAGLPVFTASADMKKYFNQFALAVEDYPHSCIAWSESYTSNYNMTFGITPASGIAQRAAHLLVTVFLQDFEVLDTPFLELDCQNSPTFAAWLQDRKSLGSQQAMLAFMMMYTDDPLFILAGADRVVRALKLWQCIMHRFGLLSADPEKHSLGLSTVWTGMIHHAFLGLTIIPQRKSIKAIAGLDLMCSGLMTGQDGRSCLGLLEHCRYAADIKDCRLFKLWKCIPPQPADFMILTDHALDLANRFKAVLTACNGSPVICVTPSMDLDLLTVEWTISSDAALEPPEQAGMGGFIYGFWWRMPYENNLEGLTIPVCELLAAGVNLIMLHFLLGAPEGSTTFLVRWEADALSAAMVLANDSAHESVMEFLYSRIISTKAFLYFRPGLSVVHVRGVANPAADLASRGKLLELTVFARGLKCNLVETQLSMEALMLIHETVAFAQTLRGKRREISVLTGHFSRVKLIPIRESNTQQPTPVCVRPSLRPLRGLSVAASFQTTLRLKPLRTGNSNDFTLPRAISKLRPLRGNLAAGISTNLSGEPSVMTNLAIRLAGDTSCYALCRGQPERIQAMCSLAHQALSTAYNPKTLARDAPHFNRWASYCRSIGTTPWRDDAAANSGADPIGHQREVVLFVNALIHFTQTLPCRPGKSNRTRCKPESAMNVLLAVRRVFKRNMLPLLDWKAVSLALKSLLRKFVTEFGPHSLVPDRAAPLTNDIYNLLFTLDHDFAVSNRLTVAWQSKTGHSLRAALGLAKSTGMRKEEIRTLTRRSLSFRIRGVIKHDPSPVELAGLNESDFLVVTPPPSKADQLGVVWGALPIWIPFRLAPGNAAGLVAQLLQLYAFSDTTLMFTDEHDAELTASFMDRALKAWLTAAGLPAAMVATLTWHSPRVGLACALLAAGRSDATIQALLRWQTVESLRIYACLGPQQYAAHLDAAARVTVSAVRATHFPMLESAELAHQLQQHLQLDQAGC